MGQRDRSVPKCDGPFLDIIACDVECNHSNKKGRRKLKNPPDPEEAEAYQVSLALTTNTLLHVVARFHLQMSELAV